MVSGNCSGQAIAQASERTSVPLKLTVSLKDLPPGEYNCQITVLDPDSQKAAFWNSNVAIVQ